MAFEPHVKQQIRFQVETSLQEMYRLEDQGVHLIASCLNAAVNNQYQLFHFFRTKWVRRQQTRQRTFQHWQEFLDQSFDEIVQKLPARVSTKVNPFKKLLHLPFKSVDLLDHQIDEQFVQRLWERLHHNRELAERLMVWINTQVQSHQSEVAQRIKEHLASRLPLTEEEHLALARDITHLVKRYDVQDEY